MMITVWPHSHMHTMVTVLANSLRDQDLTCVTLKLVPDASFLNTHPWSICDNVKWSNPRKRVIPSHPPQCSSYWKGSFRVGQLLYTHTHTHTHIYIYNEQPRIFMLIFDYSQLLLTLSNCKGNFYFYLFIYFFFLYRVDMPCSRQHKWTSNES